MHHELFRQLITQSVKRSPLGCRVNEGGAKMGSVPLTERSTSGVHHELPLMHRWGIFGQLQRVASPRRRTCRAQRHRAGGTSNTDPSKRARARQAWASGREKARGAADCRRGPVRAASGASETEALKARSAPRVRIWSRWNE